MVDDIEALLHNLRRHPDVEAPNLFAVDAADRLILDEAGGALIDAPAGTVVVIGDHYGALTLGAAAGYGVNDIRVHQDSVTGERALSLNAERNGLEDRWRSMGLGPELVNDARVVLLQMPRSLAELDEIAQTIACAAHPDVLIFAGGRDKHMARAMNDVLARSFDTVRPSLGRQKARVLLVSDPRPVRSAYPMSEHLGEINLTVVAHGAVFAGATLDIGTRFLLQHLPDTSQARTAVDLGCGSGILAVALATRNPELTVTATDQSAAAIASAAATAAANGVADRVHLLRDDAMSTIADASVDLVVCNPPFHVGAAVHTGGAIKMFEAARRVLRPGGELWTVFNSHLGYRAPLARLVGPTRQVARNQKFTVTRSLVGRHD